MNLVILLLSEKLPCMILKSGQSWALVNDPAWTVLTECDVSLYSRFWRHSIILIALYMCAPAACNLEHIVKPPVIRALVKIPNNPSGNLIRPLQAWVQRPLLVQEHDLKYNEWQSALKPNFHELKVTYSQLQSKSTSHSPLLKTVGFLILHLFPWSKFLSHQLQLLSPLIPDPVVSLALSTLKHTYTHTCINHCIP